jgi:DNA topoisomerase VI subunit B
LLEFCTRKELTIQTGQQTESWPLVVLKELVNNALDAAEKAGVPPQISVSVADGVIAAQDNGPGIPIRTVKGPLDFITTLTTAKLTCASTALQTNG